MAKPSLAPFPLVQLPFSLAVSRSIASAKSGNRSRLHCCCIDIVYSKADSVDGTGAFGPFDQSLLHPCSGCTASPGKLLGRHDMPDLGSGYPVLPVQFPRSIS